MRIVLLFVLAVFLPRGGNAVLHPMLEEFISRSELVGTVEAEYSHGVRPLISCEAIGLRLREYSQVRKSFLRLKDEILKEDHSMVSLKFEEILDFVSQNSKELFDLLLVEYPLSQWAKIKVDKNNYSFILHGGRPLEYISSRKDFVIAERTVIFDSSNYQSCFFFRSFPF